MKNDGQLALFEASSAPPPLSASERARRSARCGYLRHLLSDVLDRDPSFAMRVDLLSGVREDGERRAQQREQILQLAPAFIAACEISRLAWDDVPDFLDEELFPEKRTIKKIGRRTDTGARPDLFSMPYEESLFAPVEVAAAPPPPRFAMLDLRTTKEERDDLAKNPPKRSEHGRKPHM